MFVKQSEAFTSIQKQADSRDKYSEKNKHQKSTVCLEALLCAYSRDHLSLQVAYSKRIYYR